MYTVKAYTALQRRDRVMVVLLGDFITIACKLYEDWGGTKGIEVQRVEVEVYIDDVFVTRKLTAFDGTITFTVPIDPEVFHFGEVPSCSSSTAPSSTDHRTTSHRC